ncbi:hypothetical protein BC833DRAFT_602875 [Globomyces pollinis-pini]|nr:hypothetical protein BC833DRAFT_602875 [Globomyces pollinis-pini]
MDLILIGLLSAAALCIILILILSFKSTKSKQSNDDIEIVNEYRQNIAKLQTPDQTTNIPIDILFKDIPVDDVSQSISVKSIITIMEKYNQSTIILFSNGDGLELISDVLDQTLLKLGEPLKIIENYVGKDEQELTIKTGDIIKVKNYYLDGTCLVEKKVGKQVQEGIIPQKCFQPTTKYKLGLFYFPDSDDEIQLPEMIEFCSTQYSNMLKTNIIDTIKTIEHPQFYSQFHGNEVLIILGTKELINKTQSTLKRHELKSGLKTFPFEL